MKNEIQKTKKQLIEENEILRRRLKKLETLNKINREKRLFLSIVDQAPFSMWASKGKQGNYEIVLWNKGAEKIYGHHKKQAIGKNYLDLFVCDEERSDSIKDCESIISENKIFRNFLAEDIAEDGSKRIMLTNCFRIWDEEKKEYLQAEIGLDVSEIEKSEQEIRSLRELSIRQQAVHEKLTLLERLRAVTTSITSSIHEEEGLVNILEIIVDSVDSLIDQDTISVICICDTEDNKREKSIEEDLCIFNKSHSSAVSYNELDQDGLGGHAMLTKKPIFIDANYKSRYSYSDLNIHEPRKHSIAVLPLISGSESKAAGVLRVQLQNEYVFSEDIEEILRLFAEQAAIAVENAGLIKNLRKLNQIVAEKQELFTRSIIAVDFVHRMNNLAGPIRGWVGLIREQLEYKALRKNKVIEYLDEIESDVKNLLEAAKKLQQNPEEQANDLNSMLNAMQRNIQILYPNIHIEKNFSNILYPVKAIYSQLQHAILNLISNGLEAMSYNGTLTLRSRNISNDENEWVEITISDTGIGIFENEKSCIFEIGYSTKNPGRGYGLWRSRHVIEDLGGSIFFQSEVGKGTTFTILLPAYLESAENDSAKVRRGKILIVDDLQRWRTLLTGILEKQYDITSVNNYSDAIDSIDSEDFDVAILDVRLEDSEILNVEGIDLLRKIREKNCHTGIVILTGYKKSVPQQAFQELKPYEPFYFMEKEMFNNTDFKEAIRQLFNQNKS